MQGVYGSTCLHARNGIGDTLLTMKAFIDKLPALNHKIVNLTKINRNFNEQLKLVKTSKRRAVSLKMRVKLNEMSIKYNVDQLKHAVFCAVSTMRFNPSVKALMAQYQVLAAQNEASTDYAKTYLAQNNVPTRYQYIFETMHNYGIRTGVFCL